jgi:hypothetical protein
MPKDTRYSSDHYNSPRYRPAEGEVEVVILVSAAS